MIQPSNRYWQFPQNGGEVNRPPAGNQVLVLARGGDVFQVIMLGVGGHPRDPVLGILAHAVGVPDVEIQAQPGRIDPVANSRYCSKRSINRPGSGSTSSMTSSRWAASTQGISSS